MRLTDAGLRRARVHAQGLHRRAVGGDVAEVVSRVVGVQAQDQRAAALAVRARSSGLVAADVDEAAGETGSVVLTWTLRGTRHLHHRDDVRWIVGLLGPGLARPGRRAEQLGIAGPVGDRAVRVLRAALESEGPLTRQDVKERLAPVGVDPTGQAPIHVVRRAAVEGILCVLPGRAGAERYVLLDDWVPAGPAVPPVPPEQAAAELARRYLGAYGPATVDDFATWSGLGRPAARRAWAAIASETTEVSTSAGTAEVPVAHADEIRTAARRPVGLRLLGAFDSLLLGYADRTVVVPPEHAKRVNAGGGMVRPTVLADGQVVGTWTGLVDVDPFRPFTAAESAALDEETADVRRFLTPRSGTPGEHPVADPSPCSLSCGRWPPG